MIEMESNDITFLWTITRKCNFSINAVSHKITYLLLTRYPFLHQLQCHFCFVLFPKFFSLCIPCSCCTIFVLHIFCVVFFSCFTFSVMHFFPCCAFFMLHFFHVTLSSCCIFSVLHSFHVSFFHSHFMFSSCYFFFSFRVALF